MYVTLNSFLEIPLLIPYMYGPSTDLAISWTGQLVFDILIFLLTLLKTLRIQKEGQRSITDLFLRDGVSVMNMFSLKLIPVNC